MPPSALLREYENLRRIDFLEVNEEGKRFFEVAKEKLAEDPETLKIVTDCLCKVVWTAIDSDTSREFKTAKALIEVAKANAVKITLEASETHSGQPVACATVLDVLLAKKDAPLSLVREGLLLSVDPCEPVEKIWQSLPENIKGLIQRQKKDVILSLRINPLSRKHFIKKYLAKEPEFFMRDLRHEVQREIELSNLKGGAYEEENSHLKGPNRHALLNIIMRVSLHLNRDERRLERTRREFDGIISDLGKVSCAHSRFGIFDLIKHAHLSGEDRRDVDKRLEETFLFNEYDQKPKFIAKLERQRSTHKKPSSDEGGKEMQNNEHRKSWIVTRGQPYSTR